LGMDVNSPQCDAGGRQFYTVIINNKKLSISNTTGAGPSVSATDWQ
jgi:hypothetical protein